MKNKLFVGGLPYSATERELEELFAQAGTVNSVKIIIDRDTGRSKGFGFIEMATEDEAQAAIKQFDGYELDGRTLAVNVARPQEDRGGRSGGGYDKRQGGRGGGRGFRSNRW